MADEPIIDLLVLPASHSAPLSPDFLLLNPEKMFRATFGSGAFLLMHKETQEKYKLYPWLAGAEPQHALELRHGVFPPSNNPIAAVAKWLIENGAHDDDRFQIVFGSGNAILVFSLRKFRPAAAEVAA